MPLSERDKREVLESLTDAQIMAVAEDVTSEPARLEYRDALLRRMEEHCVPSYDPDSWDARRRSRRRGAIIAAQELAAASRPGPATRFRETHRAINRLSRGGRPPQAKQIENVWRGCRTSRLSE